MKTVVIAGYARSPFHFAHKGELATVRPDEMAAEVVRELVRRTGIDPADIEDLILLAERSVREKFGIALEREVRIIGEA